MEKQYEKIKEKLIKYNQEQLLVNYENMNNEDKEKLLKEIDNIDFNLMKNLYKNAQKELDFKDEKIESIDCTEKDRLSKEEKEKYDEIGTEKIKAGKLAVVTMAGGQGTRLGHSGPKGTYTLNVGKEMSLFEILCKTLKEAKEKYGVYVHWYIMTSNQNNKETVEFFEKNNYFNYPKEKVTFFIQGELPMVGLDGKLLVDENGFVKLASDGHGGVFESMDKSGVLEQMKNEGIEWVFVGGVDNVLVKMVDNTLIGLAESKNCLAAGKSLIKANAKEKVGVFCKRDGKPSVIEYSEISDELAELEDEKGELVYSESHILCNMFNIKRLEMISKNKLPYHVAKKKANYMNEKGELITAKEPNAYKFESFIFDAFTSLDSMVIMRVKREEEFAPVKNAEGVDSPETATKLYREFYKI